MTISSLSEHSHTVTVLYYEGVLGLEIHKAVLTKLQKKNDRVLIPYEFKKDKTIVAVLEGDVNVLNTLGDRAEQLHRTVA